MNGDKSSNLESKFEFLKQLRNHMGTAIKNMMDHQAE